MLNDSELAYFDALESNNSNSSCTISGNPLEISSIRLILFSLYASVFLVAVSGNFLVVYVVFRNKKMHTVTNVFITNLAISDLIVNFTSLWLTPMYTYVGHWVWGEWLCRGLPLFQGTSIFISTLTLMAIAVDRYIVIVRNSNSINVNDHLSMRKCFMIISLIWTVSLCLVMPYAVHMRLRYIDHCNFSVCSEEWSLERFKSVYSVVVMCLQFVVPFIIIFISYHSIWSFLSNRHWVSERSIETKRKKRLLVMLVTMVFVFAVCWFPHNMVSIIRDLQFGQQWIRTHSTLVFIVGHLISMTATCWNPILYAWLNEAFREEFLRAIPLLRRQNAIRRSKIISECRPALNRVNCSESGKKTNQVVRQSATQFTQLNSAEDAKYETSLVDTDCQSQLL